MTLCVIPSFYFRTPVIGVTTTSISSRERPKPRGNGTGGVGGARGYSSATSSPAVTRRTFQQQQQQQQQCSTTGSPEQAKTHLLKSNVGSNWDTPPTQPRPSSRPTGRERSTVDFLRVSEQQASAFKSLDSGLDMFGAVPFSTPREQASNKNIMQSCEMWYVYMYLKLAVDSKLEQAKLHFL